MTSGEQKRTAAGAATPAPDAFKKVNKILDFKDLLTLVNSSYKT